MSASTRSAQITRSSRRGSVFDHRLEVLEAQAGIAQRMGQIEDRVVLRSGGGCGAAPACGLRPACRTPSRPTLPTGASCAGSPNSTSVGKISRRSSHWRSSSIELSSTSPTSSGSSRRFQPLMKSDPRSPAAASAPGIDGTCSIERIGPVERQFGQPLDRGPRRLPGQPFGDRLVLRVVDGGVEDAVDRRRRHARAAAARDAALLVGASTASVRRSLRRRPS